jgi:hypothetical protein
MYMKLSSLRRVCPYPFAVLSVLSVGLALGCIDQKQIWSAQSRSPDGRWTVKTYTNQYSGFGNDGAETVLELAASDGSQKLVRILGAANSGSDVNLRMNWASPTHLELVYSGDLAVYFQVAKCYGIDITLRNLSEQGNTTP